MFDFTARSRTVHSQAKRILAERDSAILEAIHRVCRRRAGGLVLGLSLVIAVAALDASRACAQWADTRTGASVPDNEWRKMSGDFGGMLVVTDKADEFVHEWTHTSEAHIPLVTPASHVRRGGTVTALLFVTGCGARGDTSDVIVDSTVLRPDGSVYGDVPGGEVYAGPAPRKGLVLLSRAHLEIRIESTDPCGTYAVIAVVRDRVTGRAIRLKQRFDVIP